MLLIKKIVLYLYYQIKTNRTTMKKQDGNRTNEERLTEALKNLITCYNTGTAPSYMDVKLVEMVRDNLKTE